MTTIVCNANCMAADTRVTGDAAFYHADKIFRVGHSLFGTAGDGDASLVMIEWLRTAQRNRRQLYGNWPDQFDRYEVCLLEINPSGIYRWSGWGIGEKVNDRFSAIGTGQLAALQVLHDGGTPEDAVRAATRFDEATGPPIQVEYLKQKRKR